TQLLPDDLDVSSSLIYVTVITQIFFFQAEDGIRDRNVTGVQTCALPIFSGLIVEPGSNKSVSARLRSALIETPARLLGLKPGWRSEERRVGKEVRSVGGTDDDRKDRGCVRVAVASVKR